MNQFLNLNRTPTLTLNLNLGSGCTVIFQDRAGSERKTVFSSRFNVPSSGLLRLRWKRFAKPFYGGVRRHFEFKKERQIALRKIV